MRTTVTIAAEVLGRTEKTIREYLKNGTLKKVQPGGKWSRVYVEIPPSLILNRKQLMKAS